jgi:hypothetical protein
MRSGISVRKANVEATSLFQLSGASLISVVFLIVPTWEIARSPGTT